MRSTVGRVDGSIAAADDSDLARGQLCRDGLWIEDGMRIEFLSSVRQIEPGLLPRSNGEKYCVEAAAFVDGMSKPTLVWKKIIFTRCAQSGRARAEGRLGEPVFGNGKRNMPPLRCVLQNCDVMAEHRQIEGCGEAGGTARRRHLARSGQPTARIRWTMGSKRSDW